MQDTPYVTSREAARSLGYTIQHVRRLVREKRLDGMKLGRDWLVLRSSIEAFALREELLRLPLDRVKSFVEGGHHNE